jgi:hypothetical protein
LNSSKEIADSLSRQADKSGFLAKFAVEETINPAQRPSAARKTI